VPTCSHKTKFSFLNGNLMVAAVPAIHLQLGGRHAACKPPDS
jgi:hypothetical protein